MTTISATIITKNASRHLKACIEAILWVDEIIILDCGSNDGTQDICRKYAPKIKLYETDWLGFGKQKNRALDIATSDWILSLDADEVVTPKLKDEILLAVTNSDYAAYKAPRLNFFHDQPIKYCFGYKGDFGVKLIKRGSCRFSEDVIHERLNVYGKTGKLNNFVNHFSFNSIEERINKMNNYSSLGALKLYQNKRKTSIAIALAHASWSFIKIYFIRFGLLDGWPGFILAFDSFTEVFYKYAKLLENYNHPPQK